MSCHVCEKNELSPNALPPRERIYDDGVWRVAHAFDSSLPGWMVVIPRRHITAMGDLTVEEASVLGLLFTSLSGALEDGFGVRKAYLMFFAEGEGFEHLHIHVVPRPDDPGMRGPKVFGYPGGEDSIEASEMDRVSEEIRSLMRKGRG